MGNFYIISAVLILRDLIFHAVCICHGSAGLYLTGFIDQVIFAVHLIDLVLGIPVRCHQQTVVVHSETQLADAFGCGVNDLPLSMILSWYEQKAVCILLTLLHLGIKNIKLGPTLPAFLSPNVLNYLVENFSIAPVTTPEADLKEILG